MCQRWVLLLPELRKLRGRQRWERSSQKQELRRRQGPQKPPREPQRRSQQQAQRRQGQLRTRNPPGQRRTAARPQPQHLRGGGGGVWLRERGLAQGAGCRSPTEGHVPKLKDMMLGR